MTPATLADYQRLAGRYLPKIAKDYLEGGSEDGQTLARNRLAFECLTFSPRTLCNVSDVDSRVTILGHQLEMPAIVGPTGLNGLYAPRAEECLAQAAHAAGLPFVLSTASTSLIEDVRGASKGDLWLQLYVQEDRRIAQDMMRRARGVGYTVLMLTVDTPVHGVRDHDIRNGFRLPLRPPPRLLVDMLLHPRWCWRMIAQGGSPQLVNLARSMGEPSRLSTQAAALSRQMATDLDWTSVAWLRRHWDGPILIKGILSVHDAVQAANHGVDGIILSNHGGRQLSSAPSPLEVLPSVVDRVGCRVTVLMDGGIRRGSDIVKARALGAQAVLLGRAPLYGLASRGQSGVESILAILKRELETTLRLLGCPRVADLTPGVLDERHREQLHRLGYP
jgi:(S)-mandelate dehydrogenase